MTKYPLNAIVSMIVAGLCIGTLDPFMILVGVCFTGWACVEWSAYWKLRNMAERE